MKKIALPLILSLLLGLSTTGFTQDCGSPARSTCIDGYGQDLVLIAGEYPDLASARAAVDATLATEMPPGSIFQGNAFNISSWQGLCDPGYDFSYNNLVYGYSVTCRYFNTVTPWATSTHCAVYKAVAGRPDCPPDDSDGDGINDVIDPYPDDDTPFKFRIITSQEDENGNREYFCIETDRGDTFCYGERDPDKTLWVEIGGINYGGSQLQDMLGSVGNPEITGNDTEVGSVPVGRELKDKEEMVFGTDQTGAVSDSELLGKIVDNTKAINDNQDDLGTYLNDLRNGNAETNDLLSKVLLGQEKAAAKSQGPVTLDTSGTPTGEGTSSGDYGTGAYSNLDTSMTSEGMPGSDLDGENYSEKSWFTSFMDSNPYKTALTNSGVAVSGATCSKTLTVMGKSFEMNLCALGDSLNAAGIVLVSIVTLLSLLTVVRGF